MASSRALVLTPALDGMDGVSEVSRQAVAALASTLGAAHVEAWALDGGRPPDLDPAVRVECAGGSRARLARWALARSGGSADGLLVLVMHVHLAPLALPMAMRGARVAAFLHGVEAWRPLRRRERLAVDAAALLLANSACTAGRFKAANPAHAAREVVVCHLGLAADPPPAEPPPDRGFALIVGRLSSEERYKGHDALIAAWPAVLASEPSARLVIAGDGDDRARLEARVTARGLAGAIRFAGRVPAPALEGLYRAAAFFVMPSTGEGFGLAYLEAMRAGKACIAAPGAASEIIMDGTTGLLADPSVPGALAAALLTLFRDEGRRDRLGRAGAARVAERFGPGHFAARLLAALAPLTAPATV